MVPGSSSRSRRDTFAYRGGLIGFRADTRETVLVDVPVRHRRRFVSHYFDAFRWLRLEKARLVFGVFERVNEPEIPKGTGNLFFGELVTLTLACL